MSTCRRDVMTRRPHWQVMVASGTQLDCTFKVGSSAAFSKSASFHECEGYPNRNGRTMRVPAEGKLLIGSRRQKTMAGIDMA